MLAGAAENGSDLTIHAQVADNRRALMAAIPHTGAPLSPGQHPIRLSLNGQQFLDPSMDQPMVSSTSSKLKAYCLFAMFASLLSKRKVIIGSGYAAPGGCCTAPNT